MDFLMVIMTSGIARGRVLITAKAAAAEDSGKMAAKLQLIS